MSDPRDLSYEVEQASAKCPPLSKNLPAANGATDRFDVDIPVENSKCRNRKSIINIVEVDWHEEHNLREHNTQFYDETKNLPDGKGNEMILRRGFPFIITVHFDRAYDPEIDAVSLIFRLTRCRKPTCEHGAIVVLPINDNTWKNYWRVEIVEQQSRPRRFGQPFVPLTENPFSVTLRVTTPAYLYVGSWIMHTDCRYKGDLIECTRRTGRKVTFIFNPWCRDDEVYIDDNAARDEYVLNEVGFIYQGTHTQVEERPWVYNQFQYGVIKMVTCLFESMWDYEYAYTAHSFLSAMGELFKKDIGQNQRLLHLDFMGMRDLYKDGTNPTEWTGTLNILKTYINKRETIKFGNDYCIAGVVTTMCRAYGIPCRPVTGYYVGDRERHQEITQMWEADGLPRGYFGTRWVSNAWNEIHMTNTAFGVQHNGWHAVHLTPFTHNFENFIIEPTPVKAIRELDEDALQMNESRCSESNYNAARFYKLLNERIVHSHTIQAEVHLRYTVKVTEQYRCGKRIVSKIPRALERDATAELSKNPNLDANDISYHSHSMTEPDVELGLMDLTENYKDMTGKKHPLFTHKQAYKWMDYSPMKLEKNTDDVRILIKPMQRSHFVGEDFTIEVLIESKSDDKRTLSGMISVSAVHHFGRAEEAIKRLQIQEVLIKSHIPTIRKLNVKYDEYKDEIKDHNLFRVNLFVFCHETVQMHCQQEIFLLRTPQLQFVMHDTLQVNEPSDVEIQFINPLPVSVLHDCVLRLESPSIGLVWKSINHMNASQEAAITVTLKPYRAGRCDLVATFTSNQLRGVYGYHKVNVIGGPDEQPCCFKCNDVEVAPAPECERPKCPC